MKTNATFDELSESLRKQIILRRIEKMDNQARADRIAADFEKLRQLNSQCFDVGVHITSLALLTGSAK